MHTFPSPVGPEPTDTSDAASAVTESVSRGRLGRAMGWLTLSMQVGYLWFLALVNKLGDVALWSAKPAKVTRDARLEALPEHA